MDYLKIYCMSIHSSNLEIIKSLNYVPVGLYKNNFSQEWLRDNSGDNISHKNPFYGEYTFYYWYWKNLLNLNDKNNWVGFCSYREYWGKKEKIHSEELKERKNNQVAI